MKNGKNIALLLAGLTLGYLASIFLEKDDMPLVHKLAQPLLVFGGAPDSAAALLPTGTSLYFDEAFPEGFVRYKVYINVEGINLKSEEATEKFWLSPLTAIPIDKDQLKMLLSSYPITKDDLANILKSGQISKEEIRELLEEYSQ